MFDCYAPFYEASGRSVPQLTDESAGDEFDNIGEIMEDAAVNYQSELCR